MKINYQKELEKILQDHEQKGETPRLFLHSCCAPCSSYVLEYLSDYFKITDYYYNPNITERSEFDKRSHELERLIREMPMRHQAVYAEGPFEPERYFEAVRGLEKCPEGGERCRVCFEMRLRKAAEMAAGGGFDYMTTTLTISPLKNAALLNEIGERVCREAGVKWLPSDFKKKNGYLRSIQLSEIYGLYRQNYCGCIFSKRNDCDRITDI